MRLAAFQMMARTCDVDANLGMIDSAAGEAKTRGAELLVAPELATTGYGAADAIRDLAESVDGKQGSAITAMATRHGITIVAGFPERAGEAIYNSALLAMPNGQQFIYRKCHLYGCYERKLFASAESRPLMTELNGIKIGILICYDVEFPEAVRHLALGGAELLLVPTAQPETPDASFITKKLVPVRAFENGIAIVYANHAGADGRFVYAGASCISTPDGRDATRATSHKTEVIVADYDPKSFAASRLANPYLKDRRADLFPSRSADLAQPNRPPGNRSTIRNSV